MSWRDAKAAADAIFDGLRGKHPLTFIEMVLRALQRRLSAEKRKEKREGKGD